ncbi:MULTISPECIES: hypothetical protein [unclassified Sphingopyxis]|nr:MULTISPECIES: hypothetical protein [unclassified Sphingopyxis]
MARNNEQGGNQPAGGRQQERQDYRNRPPGKERIDDRNPGGSDDQNRQSR